MGHKKPWLLSSWCWRVWIVNSWKRVQNYTHMAYHIRFYWFYVNFYCSLPFTIYAIPITPIYQLLFGEWLIALLIPSSTRLSTTRDLESLLAKKKFTVHAILKEENSLLWPLDHKLCCNLQNTTASQYCNAVESEESSAGWSHNREEKTSKP